MLASYKISYECFTREETHHDHEKMIRDRESRYETPCDDRPCYQLAPQVTDVECFTSPMTLDECLVLPCRLGSAIVNAIDLQIMTE